MSKQQSKHGERLVFMVNGYKGKNLHFIFASLKTNESNDLRFNIVS